MFAHADTVNEPAVFSTGPCVAIPCPEVAPGTTRHRPTRSRSMPVAVLPLPDASGTDVPEVWSSRHRPAIPLVSACTVCDVWLPIGS